METFAFNVKPVEAGTDSDFEMSASPASQMVTSGEDVSYTINVTAPQRNPSVRLNVSGVPEGVTYSLLPSLVSPNDTSNLKLTMSTSAQSGSYSLMIKAQRGNVTRTTNVTLVLAALTGQVAQSKTGTLTFSWSKTLEEGRSFSIASSTVTVHVKADMSLTMPLKFDTTSNETLVKAGCGTWIAVSASSGSAQIAFTIKATGSIGSTSQSTTQTWTKSFSTPLGVSSEIVFPTFSIPAIDAIVGKVTIDLTPKASLVGSASSGLLVNGPGSINKQSLQWWTSGIKRTMLATLSEEKEVQVCLSSALLTINQLNVGTNLGASLQPIIGSQYSISLGSIQFPIQSDIQLNGSPSSLVIVEYNLPPSPPFTPPSTPTSPSSPYNLYWVLIGIGSIGTVTTIATGISLRKRRRQKSMSNTSIRKSTDTLAEAQPGEAETGFLLVSSDYGTGALCYIDNYPLENDSQVLKCPHCGALFHEECIQSLLELRSRCPKCGNPLSF